MIKIVKVIYLVGAIIQANKPEGWFHKACKIGKAKAAVLPEPVWARPIISRPKFEYN